MVWATIEGFFWIPRTLMGFEKMMHAYEDEPELLHLINEDLPACNLRLLDQMREVCVPSWNVSSPSWVTAVSYQVWITRHHRDVPWNNTADR